MIGFLGTPFTVASYMIEGLAQKRTQSWKRLRYQEPSAFKGLLDLLVETTIDYLIWPSKRRCRLSNAL